jgi:hypothetical protein
MLHKFDPELAEITTASRRPYTRFSIHYNGDRRLVHVLVFGELIKMYGLRAESLLATGATDEAFSDVITSSRLVEALQSEPFGRYWGYPFLRSAIQLIWDGLAKRQWSDEQLVAFQKQLERFDQLADYQQHIRVIRIDLARPVERLLSNRRTVPSDFIGSEKKWRPKWLFYRFAPSGWFYLNLRTSCQLFQDALLSAVDVKQQRVYPRRIPDEDAKLNTRFFFGLLIPGHGVLWVNYELMSFTWTQTGVNEAVIACALERYRLAYGKYPETLESLTPGFSKPLPHDLIDGEPLKYRRIDDNHFVLYSIGWNEVDDGGVIALREHLPHEPNTPPQQDIERGDWVWQYPP